MTIAILGCLVCAGPEAEPVQPGIDVLLADSTHLVANRRVGLLTNQTGVDRVGRDDVARLQAAGVTLSAIFSPEHGFRGVLDQDNIGNGVDSATGLPVFSLYGAVRAPTAEMLAGIDVLLVDLQDVGTRTYTYVSTALLALRAAAAVRVPVVVLDRPNPIGGQLVQGPVLDTALASFIGMLPVPLRHGLTIGELLRLAASGSDLEPWLHVVPVRGWSRDRWFDEVGLPWVRPSPNLPSLESATHYPGLVLFEASNLSVGRGTPLAFQVVAAPWLDAAAVARSLGAVTGVAFSVASVTPEVPSDGKFAGITMPAVRLRVTDRTSYDPVATAVRLLDAIRARHGDSLRLDPDGFDRRAGTRTLRMALERGTPPEAIAASWGADLAAFERRRQAYLLYR